MSEVELEVEEVEVEAFAKEGGTEQAPKAQRYIIRVDKTKLTLKASSATGREILTLASRTPPEQYKLSQKMHGGARVTIGLDDVVDFRAPGVERFMTLKRGQTEG